MIEDIKKKLKILFMTYVITPCPDYMKKDTRTEVEVRGDIVTTIKLVNEILDKYKDIDKYKNAWEELKKVDMGEEAPSFGELWEDIFKELEQKHNISKEME